MIETYKLNIFGKVQGVSYRIWFLKKAENLNIKGYIKNLNNQNEVEAIIQGNLNNIKELIKLSYKGPPLSSVKIINKTKIYDNVNFDKFTIQ